MQGGTDVHAEGRGGSSGDPISSREPRGQGPEWLWRCVAAHGRNATTTR